MSEESDIGANARRPWLIIVLDHGIYHIEESCVITNPRSTFQCLEGASDLYTHAEGQSSMNIEQITELNQANQPQPPNISSGTLGTTMYRDRRVKL